MVSGVTGATSTEEISFGPGCEVVRGRYPSSVESAEKAVVKDSASESSSMTSASEGR